MPCRLNAERSAMPVMMPGSAIGSMTSSEIASRPKNRARASAAAAQVPSTQRDSAVATAATLSDKAERRPDVGRGPRRRRTIAWSAPAAGRHSSLLGGEGIERRSGRSADAGTASPAAAAIFSAERARGSYRIRAHRRPPFAWRARDRAPMMTIGTTVKAAASGMLPAVPCWA